MKKILFILVLFFNTAVFACPDFYFHLNFSGTRTFRIQNMTDVSDYIDVTGNGSINAWDFSSSLGNPCGITFGPGICYSIIEVTEHLTNDELIAIKFTGASPNHLTINYDGATKTFTVGVPGNTSAYSLSWGNVFDNPPACLPACNGNVLISGTYTTSLTQSLDWIITLDATVIPASATVTLDADPVNGFVFLDHGFEAQPGAVLIAQALDGCGSEIPMRMPVRDRPGIAVASTETKIKIYPNPVRSLLTVVHPNTPVNLAFYNNTGKLMASRRTDGNTRSVFNVSTWPAGIYYLSSANKIAGSFVKE